jgi:CubicO group peptidase (beta-lactamase class C family)
MAESRDCAQYILNRVKIAGTVVAAAFTAASLCAQTPSQLDRIAMLVDAAVSRHELPGAVVLAGRGDDVLYRRAFGHRAVEPSPEPMTEDTIFDVASLTKVVATTTSVMKLVEDGRVRLSDRVSTFIPGFERYNKADITVRQLMTHTSGLRPDVDLGDDCSATS